MTQDRPDTAARRRTGYGLKTLLTGTILVLFMALILTLVLDVRRQLQRLDSAASEAALWALTQAELEASRLEVTTMRAAKDPSLPLDEVRVRFDIFYSRTEVLKASPSYEALRYVSPTQEALIALESFFESWVPIIDGPDDALRAKLPELAESANKMRLQTRVLSLDGITNNAVKSAAQRNSVSRTLFRIAWLTIVLVTVLLVLLVTLVRLARLRERQSRRNREISRRMETIIATAIDAVIVVNREGRIVDYNGAAECIFGYPRAVAIGADMAELIIPKKYRSAHFEGMARHLKNSATRRVNREVSQFEAVRKDGTLFPIEISRSSAMTPQGELFVAFIRDISDRLAAETELRSARDRAIAGEKSKAQLLAVMSHEMRTPLNGILGTLDLMGLKGFDPRQARYLSIVRKSANMLLDQVNSVLDISRLDANKMQIDKRRFDLVSLVNEVIDSQLGAAATQGNTLGLAPPSPLLHDVYTDPERLRQVLLNLLSNAIKFTQNGRIKIEIDCENGLDEVEIRVIDSGIGINEEDLDRIFGDFVTVDASYQRRTMGTGLGLGISRRLAKALGGELGAESEPGDGSVFWLRLPLAPPAGRARLEDSAETNVKARQSAIDPLNVLIVEDNAVNRLILRRMLESDGHHVTEAFDGVEGVETAEAKAFDIILMDISMPGMDGLTATRNIRNGGGPNAKTPMIATTAHALPDELEAFCRAGMCEALVKPISRDALRGVLHAAINEAAPDHIRVTPSSCSNVILDADHLRALQDSLSEDRFQATLHSFADEMNALLSPGAPMPDHDNLSLEAHRLAGSAGVVGAMQLTRRLQDIEWQSEVATPQTLDQLMDEARGCWRETRMALKDAGLLVDEMPTN